MFHKRLNKFVYEKYSAKRLVKKSKRLRYLEKFENIGSKREQKSLIAEYVKKSKFISRIRRRRVDLRNFEPQNKKKWRLTLRLKLRKLWRVNKMTLLSTREKTIGKRLKCKITVGYATLKKFAFSLVKSKKQYSKIFTQVKSVNPVGINTNITFALILASTLDIGEMINPIKKNDAIVNFFYCVRNNHAIYNINKIIYGLRLTITSILTRTQYRKCILINYAQPREHGTAYSEFKDISLFPRKKFLVTWEKWIGGILTNFKRLSTRLVSRMINDKLDGRILDYNIDFPKLVPRLPAFVANLTNSHWALNESKRMRIATTQLIETSHMGYFGDINLAINTHYLGLRAFTRFLLEASSWQYLYEKHCHKDKLWRRISYTIATQDKLITEQFLKRREEKRLKRMAWIKKTFRKKKNIIT